MGNKISLICNAKYSEIFTFFQQDDENKLTTCVSVVLSRQLFSLFWAFYAITVLPFIRWSQGNTRISTVVNSEAVCVRKIHPIGIFFASS